ncbi:hypothetical protein GE09DRAFT_757061 [Coniochaeta sp. 2T2.1]|nr:hypothetical protein GE09DRAFT_757061 [Coniochaeta sp. 2T2.1]
MEATDLDTNDMEPTTEDLVTRIPTLLGREDIARWKEELLRQLAHEGTADYVLNTDAEVIKDRHVSVCITSVLLLGTTLFYERLERAGWCFEQTLNKDPKEYYEFVLATLTPKTAGATENVTTPSMHQSQHGSSSTTLQQPKPSSISDQSDWRQSFADLVASTPGISDGSYQVKRFFEKAAERRGTMVYGSVPRFCHQCQLKYRVYVGPGHLSGYDLHRLDADDIEALLVVEGKICGYVVKYIAHDTDQALKANRAAHKDHFEAIRGPDGAVRRPDEAIRRPNEAIRSRVYDNDIVMGCITLLFIVILFLLYLAVAPSSRMSAPLVPLRQPFRFV